MGRVVMQNVVKKYEKWFFLREFVTLACGGHLCRYCTHGRVHTKVERGATMIGRVVMQNIEKDDKWRPLRTLVTLACEGQLSWCTVLMDESIRR